MTVEKREHEGNNRSVVMTECPFCGEPIGDNRGFEDHIESGCEELPA